MSSAPQLDRRLELLADQALSGLTADEEVELSAILASEGEEDLTLAVAAAALELAMLRPRDLRRLPRRVHRRLAAAGTQWACATAAVVREPQAMAGIPASTTRQFSRKLQVWAPWLTVAAGLILALAAWLPPSVPITKSQQRSIARASDALDLAWTGATGSVVWSDSLQKGYMVISGLSPNQPGTGQYQVWIEDSRGPGQRISAGVFDVPTDDAEVLVALRPPIAVKGARAFAVTLEEPGGAWVSDMLRVVARAP
jgi:hypothetical protein